MKYMKGVVITGQNALAVSTIYANMRPKRSLRGAVTQ